MVEGPIEYRHSLATLVNTFIGLGLEVIGLWESLGTDDEPEIGSWQHFKRVAPPWLTLWLRRSKWCRNCWRCNVVGHVASPKVDQWATVLTEEFPDAALDRTPESLAAVDDLIEGSLPAFDDLDASDRSDLTLAVGCYFGETLRAAHEARWVNRDDHWVLTVTFEDGAGVEVDVFGVAIQSLKSGEGAVAAAYVDAATNAGGGDEDTDGERADADADDAAAWAEEHAADLVAAWPDYDLDYTPGSLSRLDDLAVGEFGHFRDLGEATDELLETAAGFGAYFGEVLRRHDEGNWELDRGPTILVPAGDGDGVGVDAVQAAATCLAGNASFAGVRADLRERGDG